MPHFFIRKYILILAFVFYNGFAIAQSTDQNYPVTAQAFVVAQPGKKLSAYFSNTQALTVSLLLKDLTKTSIDVYLRWSIDGPGVRIASVDGYIPPLHFNLQRGMLQHFSGLDLQSMYFRQDVMEAQGLTGPPTRASLPEGFYTFRVQALEAGTGREVSNLGETYFSITSPLPPVINIPFNGATLASTGSASGASAGSLSLSKGLVEVQWMPRHYKLPGNITTYDLKVCKIPDGYEPQEAMDACVNPIIDDKGNPGTFYPSNTGIGNSIIGDWEQASRYAVRVTVHEFDTNGEEVVFANEGRSEVTWFRYGELCISPESFSMKETGPGRVQLSWGAQPGIDNYKILYRPSTSSGGHPSASSGGQGENNWKVQAVSGNTGVIQGLTKGKYEFAVQSGCAGQIPDHTQTWEMGSEDDDLDDLPPALVSPLQILVQVSGCNAVAAGNLADYYANFPGGSSSPADSTKLKIPACALQSGAFADCDAELPVIPVPTGSIPLNSLRAGDVLGIYDFAAFVTEASQTPSGFSGKALVRLPFLQGALALAEFSGLKAWSAQGEGSPAAGSPDRGGCVYDVTIFQLINVSQTEVAEAKAKLLNTLAKQTDPTAFAGTLAGALLAYDRMSPTATADSVCRYKTAILQATGQITDALTGLDSDHPILTGILKDLKTIADSLQAGNIVDHITDKYEAILARLDSLKAADTDTNPSVLAIGNVQVNELTGQSARISWEATGDVAKTPSRYIIEYTDPNGATLPETVTSTQVNLQRLLPGTQYKYRITAYDGDQVLATYGEDAFTTPKKVVPTPENLAYTAVGYNGVSLSWDKNRDHRSYKLIYTDQFGEEKTLYPTINTARIEGLARDQKYAYRIVAVGDNGLQSEVVNSEFNIGTVCETRAYAAKPRIIQGEQVQLWLAGCLDEDGRNGPTEWTDGENTFSRRVIYVTPQKTTTYVATCLLTRQLPNGQTEPVHCPAEVTVIVDKKCEGVVATVTPTSVEQGDPVMLRSTGCNGIVEWQTGYPSGQSLGRMSNLLVFPNDVGNYPFTLSCTDKYNAKCFAQTEMVTVETNCNNFALAVQTYGAMDGWFGRSIKVSSVGCPGDVSWSVEENRGAARSHPDNHTILFERVVRGFTVNATCATNACTATTGYIDNPTSYNLCTGAVKLVSETINTITLEARHTVSSATLYPWHWKDTGTSENPRTFPKPNKSQVYFIHIDVGKSGCEASYAYDATYKESSFEIPCVEFEVTVPQEVVILRDANESLQWVSARNCTDGTKFYSVYWRKNNVALNSSEVIFTRSDAQAGKVTLAATCSLTGVLIERTVNVRLETLEEERCRKSTTNRFYSWVEPPVSSEGAFFEPKFGARAKVYVVGCEGTIRWQSLPMKDLTIKQGVQTSYSESEVWFSVPTMQTSYYYVTCLPKCGPDKVQLVVVKVRPTPEDKTKYPQVITSAEETTIYSEPSKNCAYPEANLTVDLGAFKPKSQENNRGGYNHIIVRDQNNSATGMVLMAQYCYNGSEIQKPRGEPRWFKNAARTQLYENYNDGITIISDIPKVETTYYGRCFYTKTTYCDFQMTIKVPSQNGREAVIEGNDVEANDQRTDQAQSNCVYTTSQAISLLLTDIICRTLPLVPGNSREKLEILKEELLAKGVSLSPITDELIKKYQDGDCEGTIALLVKDITGNDYVYNLARIVNTATSNTVTNQILNKLSDDEVINSDFIIRQIETFDGPIEIPNARIQAIGVCPDYYFTPSGKRIRIPDIGNCVVSINGVLMSFERNGKKYIPLYKRSTLAFIGYHEEADFNLHATISASTTTKIAQKDLLTKWIIDTEYPAENSKIGRFISFIEENKNKPGVVSNYTEATFTEIKTLLAQLPETIFENVEGTSSVFLFDLLKIKNSLSKTQSATDAQLAMLNSILTNPETVCTQQSEVTCKVYACVYSQITGNQSRDVFNGRLPLENRKRLLTLLAQSTLTSGTLPGGCAFSSDGEGTVVSLLRTTPETDRKAVLDHLYSFAISTSDATPLKAFISKIDGANFDDFMLILSDWVTTQYPSQESWSAILQRQDRAKRTLMVLGDWSLGSTLMTSVKDGRTLFDFNITVLGKTPILKPNIDALDYVVVKFTKDFSIGSTTFRTGELYKIPAMLCYLIMNDQKNKSIATTAKYTAYALGAAVGVSEIMAASTAVEMTYAIIDMGMLATDFMMNEALATKLNQTQAGKTWLDNFNKFVLAYGAGRGLAELSGLTREMRTSASVINDEEVNALTSQLTAKIGALGSFAAKLQANTKFVTEIGDLRHFTTVDDFVVQFEKLHKLAPVNSIKPLNDVMDDFDYFVTNHINDIQSSQFKDFLDEMMQTANATQADKFKAAATSLEVIRNPQKYIPAKFNLDKLELEDLISYADDAGDFRFDIKWNGLRGTDKVSIFIDTKNYSTASNMFKSLGQYKAYLAKINNFDELYIIQQGGRGFTRDQIINRLQSAIISDAKGVFDSNQTMFKNLRNNNNELIITNFDDFNDFINSTDFKQSAIANSLKTTN